MPNRHIAEELLGIAENMASLKGEDDPGYSVTYALVGIGHAMLDIGNAIRGRAPGEPEALAELAVIEGRQEEFISELVERFGGAVTDHIAKSDREMIARRLASGLRQYFGWEEYGVASRWQHDREAQLLKTAAARTAAEKPAADEE